MSGVTAVEIALDLEIPQDAAPVSSRFARPTEPRICVVAAFASTSQLPRIVAAINRGIPSRPPPKLRLEPPPGRSPLLDASPRVFLLEPMIGLLRLQSKMIRAISPGLLQDKEAPFFSEQNLGDVAERFIRDFIPRKRFPMLEPAYASIGSDVIALRAIGMTMYRLGHLGLPETALAHWPYTQDTNGGLRVKNGAFE